MSNTTQAKLREVVELGLASYHRLSISGSRESGVTNPKSRGWRIKTTSTLNLFLTSSVQVIFFISETEIWPDRYSRVEKSSQVFPKAQEEMRRDKKFPGESKQGLAPEVGAADSRFKRPSSSARKNAKKAKSAYKEMQEVSRRRAKTEREGAAGRQAGEETEKEQAEKLLTPKELALLHNPVIPMVLPHQVDNNRLEPQERKRKWKAFDFLCLAVRREGTGSLVGMAQWRKTKTPEVFAFQAGNVDKFISDDFVLVFVLRRRGEGSFFMEPKSKNSDQRRLRDCY